MPKLPPSPDKLREREVTKQFRDLLRARGWRLIRNQRTVINGAFQTGEPGIPDYLCLFYMENSVVCAFWAELKRLKGGKLSPHQVKWHFEERARGGVVVDVSDIKIFDEWYMANYGWLHTEWQGRKGQEMMQFEGATW